MPIDSLATLIGLWPRLQTETDAARGGAAQRPAGRADRHPAVAPMPGVRRSPSRARAWSARRCALLAGPARAGRGLGLRRPPPGQRAARCETLPSRLRALFAANAAYSPSTPSTPTCGGTRRRATPTTSSTSTPSAPTPSPHPARGGRAPRALRRRGAAAKGRVPWRVGEVYRELVAAFRAARPRARARARGASSATTSPTPTCPCTPPLNYDGQLTGQQRRSTRAGRAARRALPRASSSRRAAVAAARAAADPVALTFDALRESFRSRAGAGGGPRVRRAPRPRGHARGRPLRRRLLLAALRARGDARALRACPPRPPRAGSLWPQRLGGSRPPRPRRARSASPTCAGSARAVLLSLDGAAARRARRRGGARRDAARWPRCARGAPRRAAPQRAAPQDGARPRRALHRRLERPQRHRRATRCRCPGGSVLETQTGYSSTPAAGRAASGPPPRARAWTRSVVSAHPGLSLQRRTSTSGASAATTAGASPSSTATRPRGRGPRVTAGRRSPGSRPAARWLGRCPRTRARRASVHSRWRGRASTAWLYDDPADPAAGFDTLLLALGRRSGQRDHAQGRAAARRRRGLPRASPSPWPAASPPSSSACFALAGDGSRPPALPHGAPRAPRRASRGWRRRRCEASGGFVGQRRRHRPTSRAAWGRRCGRAATARPRRATWRRWRWSRGSSRA